MESPTLLEVSEPAVQEGDRQFGGDAGVGRRFSTFLHHADRDNRSAQAETASLGADVRDPALKISGLYAAIGSGRMPGAVTQQEREAKVRASIPGGDKELPSEIRRTSAEPESVVHLPPADAAALQMANMTPETRRVRAMQERIAQLAGRPSAQKGETVLQNEENKFACASTDEPKNQATEGSGQQKFYESMTAF